MQQPEFLEERGLSGSTKSEELSEGIEESEQSVIIQPEPIVDNRKRGLDFKND